MKNGNFRPPTEAEHQMLARFLILWRNGQWASIWRLVSSLMPRDPEPQSDDPAEVHLAEVFADDEDLLGILEYHGFQTCAEVMRMKPEALLALKLIGPGIAARIQARLRARFGA